MMYFFFQAEDGIRAGHVTGVQTCALPIFGRTWWATGHDVINLLGIDGLPLEQGLCHGLHLVTVFLDEIARNGVLLINDAANLTVNLLHGVLRQGIAFANTTTQEDFVIIISVHHGLSTIG